jgi:hypothetical protein
MKLMVTILLLVIRQKSFINHHFHLKKKNCIMLTRSTEIHKSEDCMAVLEISFWEEMTQLIKKEDNLQAAVPQKGKDAGIWTPCLGCMSEEGVI